MWGTSWRTASTSSGSSSTRRAFSPGLANHPSVQVFKADLERPETLRESCRDTDCVVYLAGVFFRPWPERFLPRTNVKYVENLLSATLESGVKNSSWSASRMWRENPPPIAPRLAGWTGTPRPSTRGRAWPRKGSFSPFARERARPRSPSGLASYMAGESSW